MRVMSRSCISLIMGGVIVAMLSYGTLHAEDGHSVDEDTAEYHSYSGIGIYTTPSTNGAMGMLFASESNERDEKLTDRNYGWRLTWERHPNVRIVPDPEQYPDQTEFSRDLSHLAYDFYVRPWKDSVLSPYAGVGAGITLMLEDPNSFFAGRFVYGISSSIGNVRLYAENVYSYPLTTDEIIGFNDGWRVGVQFALDTESLSARKFYAELDEKKAFEAARERIREEMRRREAMGDQFGATGIYVEPDWRFYRQYDYVTITGTLNNRGTTTYHYLELWAEVYDDHGVIDKAWTNFLNFEPGERRRFEINAYLPGVDVEDVRLRVQY